MLSHRQTPVRQDFYYHPHQLLTSLQLSRSEGLAATYHGSLLGVYTWDEDDHGRNVTRHQRRVFRHVASAGRHWLYYWDWGPNSGANWMVGRQFHLYS